MHMAARLLQANPVTQRERNDLLPIDCQSRQDRREQSRGQPEIACTTGRLNSIVKQVPPKIDFAAVSRDILETRQSLPIASYRNTIIDTIETNKVTLISGDTGCGKTTQVPQFIMEDHSQRDKPCRIIITQPRRLAALSVAERVASERNEVLGTIVGYQIRLESKVSPTTICTFCTSGVLLRTIMGGTNSLNSVTHIIVDEVHERDRFSDLLLTVLRELVPRSDFKLILMSATLNSQKFVNYFNGCPVVKVPGRAFEVQPYFLEDILMMTGYQADTMDSKIKKDRIRHQAKLLGWCQPLAEEKKPHLDLPDEEVPPEDEENTDIPEDVKNSVEELLKNAWIDPTQQVFEDLLSLYMNEQVPINYAHPETGVTALHVATCRGMKDFVEAFLSLGANVSKRTPLNDWNSLEWAKYFKFTDIIELLTLHLDMQEEERESEVDDVVQTKTLTEEEKKLLESYHRNFNDEAVDLRLIVLLLHYIVENGPEEPKGGILVFLPGYEEIVTLRDMISEEFQAFSYKFVLFTLHSQMQSVDHKRVFRPVPADTRKIVLATNIAETSITIEDVVYVIDSGKVKEKSYDAILGVTTMQSVRISQANAIQRRGRAGRCRPGICYHLYSSFRFQSLEKFQVPEIVRMPAHELCLQVKLLVPNRPLVEFLSKLPDPPSSTSAKNSIALLTAIDALDSRENLTELGLLLLDLPIEPHLGKVVLHAVVLKCLDPILTIVCCITHKDPFVIPSDPRMKSNANKARQKLSMDSFSDHMVLLKAFHGWQKAKNDGLEKRFCADNFVSSSTMEMILGLRTQLLGQLRASGFVRARGVSDIRDLNTNSENWAVVKAALAAGYFPNVIRFETARKERMISRKEPLVYFHPSSILSVICPKGKNLSQLKSDWVIYEEMTRIGRTSYARLCTVVNPLSLVIFCGPMRLPPDAITTETGDGDHSESEDEGREKSTAVIKLDDWITFKLSPEVANLSWDIRIKWQNLFLRKITNPTRQSLPSDALVIKTLADIISNEDDALGIPRPCGVGQRPIPMAQGFSAPVSSKPSAHQIMMMNQQQNSNPGPSGTSSSSGYRGMSSMPSQHRQDFGHQRQQFRPRSPRSQQHPNDMSSKGQHHNYRR